MRNLAALLLLGVALPQEQGPRYVCRNFEGLSAEYLVVAPPAFAGALDVLCDHRAKSYTVAVARTDDIAARHGAGPEGIAKLVAAVKPKFLLLAGDVDAVPTFRQKSAYQSAKFQSDEDLATDHLFGAAAGRFPADTVDELRAMVDKTVEYETRTPPGAWQKKVAFLAGEGGFGEMIDAMMERQFTSLVASNIPAGYDVEVAYAKPASKYCFYPPKFHENAVRLLNEGALFFVYVGHGERTGLDTIIYNGRAFPIFDAKSVKEISAQALPIMVVIACNTGEYDAKGDCIGEDLLKLRRGPVAFIGGTRATQPYGNTLLGHALVERVFQKRAATLGEALVAAKAGVLEADSSKFRKQADTMAALIQGRDSLEPMRKDVVLHYNLLGDPALSIRRPEEKFALELAGTAGPGRTIRVEGNGAAGRVTVTFECARDRFYHSTALEGDDIAEQIARRYANANNKVIARAEADAADGRFAVELALPADLKPGTCYVKAHAAGAIGAREVVVPEPPR
jgi:hypothetical protein